MTARVSCEKRPVRVACRERGSAPGGREGETGRTNPVRRLSDFEEVLLASGAEEVDRNGGVEDDMTVSREKEALLLVLLEGDDDEVEVERDEADRKADGGVSRAGNAVTEVAETLRVGDGGDGEERKGDEGEGEEDVEVEERVENIEVPRLGSVQLGTSTRSREEVILDDVEGDDGELLVGERVDEDDGDLKRKKGQQANRKKREERTHGNASSDNESDEKSPRTLRCPERRLVRQNAVEGSPNEELLEDDGNAKKDRKGPSDDASDGVASYSGSDALPSDLDGREGDGRAEDDKVEGEGGGEEGGRGGPHGGGEEGGPEDITTDVRTDVDSGGAVEGRFDKGAETGEHKAGCEEGDALFGERGQLAKQEEEEKREHTLSGKPIVLSSQAGPAWMRR
jgi:hypothetical protein